MAVVPENGREQTAPWPFWVAIGYAIVVLIWGTTWYGIHTQVNGTSPHVGVALRMGTASVIFVLVALARRQSLALGIRDLWMVAVAGVCFFGLNYIAVYSGAQYLTSGVVAVILSLTVPLNLVADWLIRGVRPDGGSVGAALLGLVGISLVFASELQSVIVSATHWWAASIVAASAILVAVGNVVSAQLMSSKVSWIVVNASGMAIGCVAALAWGLLAGSHWVFEYSPTWLAGFVYLVVLGSVVAFGIYMRILPTIGTTAGAYVTVLSPVLALLVSGLLEGLALHVTTFAGTGCLLLGHTLLIRRRARQRRV
jgi:drug/metabolite transporter (DMT)-like permease